MKPEDTVFAVLHKELDADIIALIRDRRRVKPHGGLELELTVIEPEDNDDHD